MLNEPVITGEEPSEEITHHDSDDEDADGQIITQPVQLRTYTYPSPVEPPCSSRPEVIDARTGERTCCLDQTCEYCVADNDDEGPTGWRSIKKNMPRIKVYVAV